MKVPILITGSHRSGSTWVGRILSTSPNTHFVGEPFNPTHGKHCPKVPIKHWFHAVTPDEEKLFRLYLSHRMGRSYHPCFVSSTQGMRWSTYYRHLEGYGKCLLRHTLDRQPVIKDPIALFSAPWFSAQFKARVVILIRHPAAFISSLKKVNWTFYFDQFLIHPELIESRLAYFQDEIKTYANSSPDLIEQGILLWRIFHYTIAQYQVEHPDWVFVRHEDLSRSPLTEFESLFQQLNLPFTSEVKDRVVDYNKPRLSKQQEHSHHQLYRDSQANIWAWRSFLSLKEIDQIQAGVADIAPQFYSENDWFPNFQGS